MKETKKQQPRIKKTNFLFLIFLAFLLSIGFIFATHESATTSCGPIRYFADINGDGVKEEIRATFRSSSGTFFLPLNTEARVSGTCSYSKHWCSNTATKSSTSPHTLIVKQGKGSVETILVTKIKTPIYKVKEHIEEQIYYISGDSNLLRDYPLSKNILSSQYNSFKGSKGYFTPEQYERLIRESIERYFNSLETNFYSVDVNEVSTALIKVNLVKTQTSSQTSIQYPPGVYTFDRSIENREDYPVRCSCDNYRTRSDCNDNFDDDKGPYCADYKNLFSSDADIYLLNYNESELGEVTQDYTTTQYANYEIELENIFNNADNENFVENSFETIVGGSGNIICNEKTSCLINSAGEYSILGSYNAINFENITNFKTTKNEEFGITILE